MSGRTDKITEQELKDAHQLFELMLAYINEYGDERGKAMFKAMLALSGLRL